MQLCRNTVTMEDKYIIEDGHRLTDKHINFACCLILVNSLRLVDYEQLCSKPGTVCVLLFSFTEHSSYFLQAA